MEKKKCNKCGIEKLLSEFYNDKTKKDGKTTVCKKCKDLKNKENYENNRDEFIEYKKEWYNKNIDKHKANSKKWRIENIELKRQQNKEWSNNNPDKVKESQKKYYEKNKEVINKKTVEWAIENKDKVKQYRKKHIQKNKESINKKRNEYDKNRRSKDSNYKIRRNLSSLLTSILKRKGIKKENNFFNCTGFKYSEYIKHFNDNFPDLLNNSDYHIDHIIPCASYDFNDKEEIKKCFNPRNLRIIPAKENMIKKDKIDSKLVAQFKIKDLLPKKHV